MSSFAPCKRALSAEMLLPNSRSAVCHISLFRLAELRRGLQCNSRPRRWITPGAAAARYLMDICVRSAKLVQKPSRAGPIPTLSGAGGRRFCAISQSRCVRDPSAEVAKFLGKILSYKI